MLRFGLRSRPLIDWNQLTMTMISISQPILKPPRLFLLVCFIILFFSCLLSFPIDDGLRHVGVAFEGISNWADVYPFSLFSEYSDLSPWYGYDLILRKSLSLFQYLPIPASTLKFLFVKFFSLILVCSVFVPLILKSEILSECKSFHSLLLSIICVMIFLTLFLSRSMLLRPFIFGTIFLVYSFGQSGYMKGAASAGSLIFLYPYLSWFYILPVVFCHFLIGDKKYAAGALMVLAVFFLFQPLSYWNLQAGLFASWGIRKQMETNITELSITVSSSYGALVLISLILSYPIYHIGRKKLDYGDLLLLTYLLPSILYIRTFMDVLLPLAFVTYSKSFISILNPKFTSTIICWKTFLNEVKSEVVAKLPQRMRIRIQRIGNSGRRSNISLKPIILTLYAVLFVFVIITNFDQLMVVNETEKLLFNIPQNSTVLSSFNQQYNILFVRPDLKIIPSSEIGMPSHAIRDEYIAFFKSGSFRALASKTEATYLVEAQDIYLEPRESPYLRFLNNYNNIKVWKILDFPD
jgi:hypothetical protein